jgi:anti-anti-sigma factor
MGLIKVKEMRRLWEISKPEFAIMIVALVAVLTFGILKGVLLASVVSITLVIMRSATPPVVVLGRVRGTTLFSNVLHPSNPQTFPGVLIMRVESSFFYYNAETIRQQIIDHVAAAPQALHTVILNMEASPFVDVAGSAMLRDLERNLQEKGVRLRIAEARARVRQLLQKQGMSDIGGSIDQSISCDDVLNETLNANMDAQQNIT